MKDASTQEQQEEKNKGGRPLKFDSVAELKQKIEEYFGSCESHVATRQVFVKKADGSQYLATEDYLTDREPFTINGLAYALRTTRSVLMDYQSGKYDDRDDADAAGDRFSNTVREAKARVAADVERRTLSGQTPSGAGNFWLTNNDDWKNQQQIDHTTGGEPMTALVEFIGGSTKPSQD